MLYTVLLFLSTLYNTYLSGVETAVQKQRQESMSELAEMEALVNVARREHAKAVVQLQQLQRQLDRDRHRAVEAMEMSKAKLEHDLEACRKKLHTTQVERNLLMVIIYMTNYTFMYMYRCICTGAHGFCLLR